MQKEVTKINKWLQDKKFWTRTEGDISPVDVVFNERLSALEDPQSTTPEEGEEIKAGTYNEHGTLAGTETFSFADTTSVIAGEFTASAEFTVGDVFQDVTVLGETTAAADAKYQYTVLKNVMIVIKISE